MITRENYQLFLDDFIAGKLKPEVEEEFVVFLDENPDLADFDLNESQEEELPHLDTSFLSGLKKDIVFEEDNLDEAIIAQLEGDLSEKDSANLDAYLEANKDKDRERRLYMLTLLRPALSETFGDKTPLYRKKAFVLPRIVWYSGAIAAGLAIFALLYTNEPSVPSEHVALKNETSHSETKIESEVKIHESELDNESAKKVVSPIKKRKPSNLKTFPKIETEERPYLKVDEEIPSLQASIVPDLNAEELPELVAMQIEPVTVQEEFEIPQESQSMSLVQYVYRKVRKKVGVEEKVVAEEEIPKDAASIIVAKVKPLISYEDENGTSFKIGSLEFKRNRKK